MGDVFNFPVRREKVHYAANVREMKKLQRAKTPVQHGFGGGRLY